MLLVVPYLSPLLTLLKGETQIALTKSLNTQGGCLVYLRTIGLFVCELAAWIIPLSSLPLVL